MQACTIITRNYLPFARALAASLQRWEPDVRLSVLIIDDESQVVSGAESFDVVRPMDLGLDPNAFHQMAIMYDAAEFSCALKPWVLEHLLNHGAQCALYLDSDMQIYAPLDGVAERASRTEMLLTPHLLKPPPPNNRGVREQHLLRTGGFNAGFVAVSELSRPFLRWWQEHLRFDCIVDPPAGLFVDQHWIDIAIHFFSHDVIRRPGFNVAYWNLSTRDIQHTAGGYAVDGDPLVFFHFSGFDPRQPFALTRHWPGFTNDPPPTPPIILELLAGYADSLKMFGPEDWDVPYGYGSGTDGRQLSRHIRRAYRTEAMACRTGLPDPFDPADKRKFNAWARKYRRAQAGRMLGQEVKRRAQRPIHAILRGIDAIGRSTRV